MPRPRPIGRKIGIRSSESSDPSNSEAPRKRQRMTEDSFTSSVLTAPASTASASTAASVASAFPADYFPPDFDTGFDTDDNEEASVYGDHFVRL